MESNFTFEKFTGRNTKHEDRITLTKSYSIGFPTKFFRDNKIEDFRFVVLYWDAAKKAIGIKFTNDENETSRFAIFRSKKGYGGGVSVRSFFRSNEIDPEKYHGRYKWDKKNIEGIGEIYVIELEAKDT